MDWTDDATLYDIKYSLNSANNISLMRWNTNTDIVSGTVDIGALSTPTIFNMSDTLYMISTEGNNDFNGFNWTGIIKIILLALIAWHL